jgi:hypothetical protein
MGDIGDGPVAPKRTFYQTMVLRDILRRARKHHGEPLSPEDWAAVWELNDTPVAHAVRRVWQALPSSPRCGMSRFFPNESAVAFSLHCTSTPRGHCHVI